VLIGSSHDARVEKVTEVSKISGTEQVFVQKNEYQELNTGVAPFEDDAHLRLVP